MLTEHFELRHPLVTDLIELVVFCGDVQRMIRNAKSSTDEATRAALRETAKLLNQRARSLEGAGDMAVAGLQLSTLALVDRFLDAAPSR